jgi:uncharacterized membrane protein YhaH (DUF805 family)
MDGLDPLFSYQGRMNRMSYFVWSIPINLISRLGDRGISAYYESAGVNPPLAVSAFQFLLWLFLLWPISAVMVKRGHDRGRPAWYSVTVLAAALLAAFVCGLTHYAWPAVAVLVAIAIYQFIEFLCLPASPKARRYDWPPSVQPEIVQVFS